MTSTHLDGNELPMSGTSMAASHVAGAVARFMSSVEDAPSPAEVGFIYSILRGYTTKCS